MKDLKKIRRDRLALLVDQAKADGLSQAAFARKHGLDPTHLSQMLTGRRGIGDSVVVRLQDSLLLRAGFMDQPIDDDAAGEISTAKARLIQKIREIDDDLADSVEQLVDSAIKMRRSGG